MVICARTRHAFTLRGAPPLALMFFRRLYAEAYDWAAPFRRAARITAPADDLR